MFGGRSGPEISAGRSSACARARSSFDFSGDLDVARLLEGEDFRVLIERRINIHLAPRNSGERHHRGGVAPESSISIVSGGNVESMIFDGFTPTCHLDERCHRGCHFVIDREAAELTHEAIATPPAHP